MNPLLPALPPAWGEWLRLALEALATLAFAMSGLIEAARKQLDPVGVCVIAFVTAFGGGTLRDLLLDRRPFFWVQHIEFLWALLALCIAAMLFMRQRHFQPTERAMLWPDAVGLGLFTAVGVDLALGLQLPPLVAVIMGVITSVFGGVLRDILCNDIPRAFNDHRPYAFWAFAGGWAYVGLGLAGAPAWLALALTVSLTAGLRLVSVWRNWQLPSWRA